MNETRKRYNKKIKTKLIVFYLHEKDLYDYALTINFNKVVKDHLKILMKGGKRKNGDY